MTYFLDSQETISLFDAYIEEFQRVFRAKGIEFGSSDDFFSFARTLNHHIELREDLVVLVKSILEKENGNVSLRTILTILAVASGGTDVAVTDRDLSRPVNLVIDFLINGGGYSRTSTDHPDPDTDFIPTDAPELHALTTEMPAEPVPPSRPPSVIPFPTDNPANSNHLSESLVRIELNSLELKHYLDSIDQRISRIEPRLENGYSLPLPAAEPHPRDKNEARFSTAIPPETVHPAPVAAPLQPDQASAKPAHPSPELPSNLWTTIRHLYSSNRRWSQIPLPVLAGLLALLLCAILYWGFARNETHAEIRSANQNIDGLTTTPRANVTPNVTATPTSTAPEPLDQPHKSAAPLPFDQVHVSSGVMAGNLLSAPRPTYPRLANITHVEGKVTMEAVISKRGKVENVHVINGPHLLRGAAKTAVRNWRYRPYAINGQPVGVTTTVSVNFTRRP